MIADDHITGNFICRRREHRLDTVIYALDGSRRAIMSKTWKTIHIILESITMAIAYGLAMISLMWELAGFLVFWAAIGILMNVLLCSRTKRWDEPEEEDIYWFD